MCAILLFSAANTILSPAQTFKTLISFNGTDGSTPNYGSLVQGLDGKFYGTTEGGGAKGSGTVYKITASGKLTSLYSFCSQTNCVDGGLPNSGLVLATNGKFYGTTSGTAFKMSSGGASTTVHSFHVNQGRDPFSGLVQATDGNFYGVAISGGNHGSGTVFKITPSGNLTMLYSFCSQAKCVDGANPDGVLIQGNDGNFYGTTYSGGASVSDCGGTGCGTVFDITPGGTLTTLYSFCSQTNCTDGANPHAGLIQGEDGNFYGTTWQGGGTECGVGCGTVYRITSSGTLTTMHAFDGKDGSQPSSELIQATDGNLYGTTLTGGSKNDGTIFRITLNNMLTTLHCFNFGNTGGGDPLAGVFQATNGSLYGTTSSGGAFGDGTVFRLSLGLGPLVETLPTSGSVGAAIKILGTKLKAATAVSFNGTAATFTVVSNTEIKALVPEGATTGFVTVTTPDDALKSNKKFRVTMSSD